VKVVLVLGGGGAKALAHAGAWQALQERGATVTHIVGTSMGAVIGAALAAGTTAAQVVQVAESLSPKDVASLDVLALVKGIFASSILKTAALKRTIGRLVSAARFADLTVPLTVTTTDVDSGELVLFGQLGADAPLVDILYASCALPLYFAPARIGGRRLADGGLRAVLPLQVAARIPADVVVAVHVGPGFDETLPPATTAARPVPPLIRAHGEAIRIMMAAQTETAIEQWPAGAPRLVVVRPVAEREATFAVGQTERYFKAGYQETKRAMQKRV
jgi:NTE family protein